MSELDSMSHNNWYEVKFKANGNVKDVQLISTNDAVNHGEYVFCLTPETANHPNGSVGGSGANAAVGMVRGLGSQVSQVRR